MKLKVWASRLSNSIIEFSKWHFFVFCYMRFIEANGDYILRVPRNVPTHNTQILKVLPRRYFYIPLPVRINQCNAGLEHEGHIFGIQRLQLKRVLRKLSFSPSQFSIQELEKIVLGSYFHLLKKDSPRGINLGNRLLARTPEPLYLTKSSCLTTSLDFTRIKLKSSADVP